MSRSCIQAFFGFIALFLVSCTSAPTDADIASLKLQGEALLESVERYAGQHDGVYPANLDAAGVTPPETRWGRWKYSTTQDAKITVSVGDYLRHGFTLSWQPGHGWYLDT